MWYQPEFTWSSIRVTKSVHCVLFEYRRTGETTRGLPAPQYGELKNFGYVPKPGQTVVMRDWQKYIPSGILQTYLPRKVLEKYLDKDTLKLLEPTTKGLKLDKTIVGWQMQIPAKVVKQYVPLTILQKYVPAGVVLGTDDKGSQSSGAKSANSTSTSGPSSSPVPANSTGSNAQVPSDAVAAAPKAPEPGGAAAVEKPGTFVGGSAGSMGAGGAAQSQQPAAGPNAQPAAGAGQAAGASSSAQLVPVTTQQGTLAYVPADQLRPAPQPVPYTQQTPYVPVQPQQQQQPATYVVTQQVMVPAPQYIPVPAQQQFMPAQQQPQMYGAAPMGQPMYVPQQPQMFMPHSAAVPRPGQNANGSAVPAFLGPPDLNFAQPGQIAAALESAALPSILNEVLNRHNLYR